MEAKMSMTVSLIAVSYNSSEFICSAIEFILVQHHPHIEYIIIDGGSKDGTFDLPP